MQITKTDKVNCDNLIRLLARAKVELEGATEILGTAEVLRWMSSLAARIDKEIKEQEDAQKLAAAAMTARAVLDPAANTTAPSPAKKSRSKKGE